MRKLPSGGPYLTLEHSRWAYPRGVAGKLFVGPRRSADGTYIEHDVPIDRSHQKGIRTYTSAPGVDAMAPLLSGLTVVRLVKFNGLVGPSIWDGTPERPSSSRVALANMAAAATYALHQRSAADTSANIASALGTVLSDEEFHGTFVELQLGPLNNRTWERIQSAGTPIDAGRAALEAVLRYNPKP